MNHETFDSCTSPRWLSFIEAMNRGSTALDELGNSCIAFHTTKPMILAVRQAVDQTSKDGKMRF